MQARATPSSARMRSPSACARAGRLAGEQAPQRRGDRPRVAPVRRQHFGHAERLEPPRVVRLIEGKRAGDGWHAGAQRVRQRADAALVDAGAHARHEQAERRVGRREDRLRQRRGPVAFRPEEQDAAQPEGAQRLDRAGVECAGAVHRDGAEGEEHRRLATREEIVQGGVELRCVGRIVKAEAGLALLRAPVRRRRREVLAVELQVKVRRMSREHGVAHGPQAVLRAQPVHHRIGQRARDDAAGRPDDAMPGARGSAVAHAAEVRAGQPVGRGHDARREADRRERQPAQLRHGRRVKAEVVRDDDVVRRRLGQQRGQRGLEAGRDRALQQRLQRDEPAPLHREHAGVVADEILARRLVAGDKAQPGRRGVRRPVGMADERDRVPARLQPAAPAPETDAGRRANPRRSAESASASLERRAWNVELRSSQFCVLSSSLNAGCCWVMQ
ncbi:MAG: hypothetical protein WDO13_02330 [Verrucomicrobiota bacterium]